jgi:hypothetical protein
MYVATEACQSLAKRKVMSPSGFSKKYEADWSKSKQSKKMKPSCLCSLLRSLSVCGVTIQI